MHVIKEDENYPTFYLETLAKGYNKTQKVKPKKVNKIEAKSVK